MKRRTFLKTTLAAAGAALVTRNPVAGCEGEGGVRLQPDSALFPQSVASGDPRADSVVLWTRVADPDAPTADAALTLEVGTDAGLGALLSLEGADRLSVTAFAAHDHCVRVKVTGLPSGTWLWYRFSYETGGVRHQTRIGRTKTAPAVGSDVGARFAVTSCQDFIGRYYNTWRHLVATEPDLDFVVFLGDYIYETTGDPIFQTTAPDRAVTFDDEASALVVGDLADGGYRAARSLSNYRQLYRTYRGDADLQAAHERYPFVIIWDDHEFSDDAWGAHATYHDGREDELDVARRRHANQAWWEYMPVDYGAADFVYDPTVAPPNDLTIYRDLVWGDHVHLIMTDLRSYRTDHLIPEDAFPGAIMLDAAVLAGLAEVPDGMVPYISDIGAFEGGAYVPLLAAEGATSADLALPIDADYLSGLIAAANAAGGSYAPLEADALAAMPRGFAWRHAGKNSKYAYVGARYFAIEPAYNLLSARRFEATGGASEEALGQVQRAWFVDTVKASQATWKLWGSEFVMMPKRADLSTFDLPAAFQQVFMLSVEDWDGFPTRRDALLRELANVDDLVVLSGDLHSFWAGFVWPSDAPEARIVELSGGAISSGEYKQLLLNATHSDPVLAGAGAAALALIAEDILLSTHTQANPHMAYANLEDHGYIVVDADASRLEADFVMVPSALAARRVDASELAAAVTTEHFRTERGGRALDRKVDGVWKRWNTLTLDWDPIG